MAPRSRSSRGGFSHARAPVPLRLSAASNGLQFSHHFNGSFYAPPYYSDAPTPRPAPRPLKKQQTSPAVLTPIDPNKGAAASPPTTIPLRRTVSSLVPPDLPKHSLKQKAKNALDTARPRPAKSTAANPAHRLSSSAASIHSTTSSFRSRKRKYYHLACLTSMPCEILDEIFSHLPQRDLHAVLLCNKYLADSVAPALYAAPRFASTYRFAQFVSVITHSPLLANLVRELELESVAEAVPEDLPVAGWRDWKYRSDPLHTIRREPDGFRMRKGGLGVKSGGGGKGMVRATHPLPSPFLTQYHTCRDVPMGGVLHIMVACSRLRKINLSNVVIADDYAVLPPAAKYSGYKPTAFTTLLFVSDVPKSYTWRSEETKALHAAVELVNAVTKLRYLESFEARRGVWLTSGIASRLVSGCVRGVEWDFRECGGYKGERWARKGSSDEISGLLVESSP
ncbi:hypothetical protein TWF696_001880 [Orbilia brochopaga]|uniref:F-box domain-containing protein n=1 Tax=Orbilia brochopaga TaxID=3140254 RepID=A0AAV9U8S5_9PEZI